MAESTAIIPDGQPRNPGAAAARRLGLATACALLLAAGAPGANAFPVEGEGLPVKFMFGMYMDGWGIVPVIVDVTVGVQNGMPYYRVCWGFDSEGEGVRADTSGGNVVVYVPFIGQGPDPLIQVPLPITLPLPEEVLGQDVPNGDLGQQEIGISPSCRSPMMIG